jgi:hypothetical protein
MAPRISLLVLLAGIVFSLGTMPNSARAGDAMFLTPAPIATDPQWAATAFFGASAGADHLLELLQAPWNAHFRQDYFVGGALSRQLNRIGHFALEAEIGTGYRPGETKGYDFWGALFLRYDGFPWNNYVYTTAAICTGVNYLTDLPLAEIQGETKTAHLLHYLAPELTFALPEYRNHELVIRYHHRSGVFGLFWGVWGGSNVIAGGYRYHF